jgi:hypothetical protein
MKKLYCDTTKEYMTTTNYEPNSSFNIMKNQATRQTRTRLTPRSLSSGAMLVVTWQPVDVGYYIGGDRTRI